MNKKASLGQRLCAAPHILWSAIVIVVPLLMVVYYAFTDASGAFSLEGIRRLSDYTTTFLRSLWFGIIATIICLVIAYPLAYVISQLKVKSQAVPELPLQSPLQERTKHVLTPHEMTEQSFEMNLAFQSDLLA